MSIKVSHLSVCKKTTDFNQHEQDLNQLLHDIKSPISSINLCIRHLETKTHGLDSNEAFPILKLAIERLNSLVSNNISRSSFDIFEILSSVISEVKFSNLIDIQLKNFTDSFQDITLFGNGDVFKTILFNIINNSINASATLVTVQILRQANGLIINLVDNGKGIEKKLFQFIGKTGFSFQKNNSAVQGQGLGLSHAAETINSWQGSLTVTSEVNKGTEISIFLATN